MIPAKVTCPPSWTREYYGYLMSSRSGNNRLSFICVDEDAVAVPGSHNTVDGPSLLYHDEVSCHGLSCPPYEEGAELACVVCTK